MEVSGDTANKVAPAKRHSHLSKDGKWRSFPKVPHLLQYVSNGNYYARIKSSGKLIRHSLKTTVWTIAKLRLVDFLKKHQESKGTLPAPKFTEAVQIYERNLESNSQIKPQSKKYRHWCLKKIKTSWPELWGLSLDEITAEACQKWAAALSKTIASHYYNNTIATLKQVIDAGVEEHRRRGGGDQENPARQLLRVRIKQKELQLPEASRFHGLVANIRGRSEAAGDLIEFLAFSGLRINSEAFWVTWEDIDWQRKEIVVRGHPTTGTKNSSLRRIPIISDLAHLLERLQGGQSKAGRILKIKRCREVLGRACDDLGIPRITHHDLRHLFATRCIESGVDIPTVSRWLGHKDGGALAMRTYGHLRNEHSQQMAQKVKF
jgi:integrase